MKFTESDINLAISDYYFEIEDELRVFLSEKFGDDIGEAATNSAFLKIDWNIFQIYLDQEHEKNEIRGQPNPQA